MTFAPNKRIVPGDMNCPSCTSPNVDTNGDLLVCQDCCAIVDDAPKCPECGSTHIQSYADGSIACYACQACFDDGEEYPVDALMVDLDNAIRTGLNDALKEDLDRAVGANQHRQKTQNTWQQNTVTTWQPCRHYFQSVVFPDGTEVVASSLYAPSERRDGESPDFGVYLAHEWRPVSLAYAIDWTDYNLPNIPMLQVAEAAYNVLDRARKGQVVEVGCWGGHGRTGTFLAILATLCGVPASEAVTWVRGNYCGQAIESAIQEWYVVALDATLRGLPVPPKPWRKPPAPRRTKAERRRARKEARQHAAKVKRQSYAARRKRGKGRKDR